MPKVATCEVGSCINAKLHIAKVVYKLNFRIKVALDLKLSSLMFAILVYLCLFVAAVERSTRTQRRNGADIHVEPVKVLHGVCARERGRGVHTRCVREPSEPAESNGKKYPMMQQRNGVDGGGKRWRAKGNVRSGGRSRAGDGDDAVKGSSPRQSPRRTLIQAHSARVFSPPLRPTRVSYITLVTFSAGQSLALAPGDCVDYQRMRTSVSGWRIFFSTRRKSDEAKRGCRIRLPRPPRTRNCSASRQNLVATHLSTRYLPRCALRICLPLRGTRGSLDPALTSCNCHVQHVLASFDPGSSRAYGHSARPHPTVSAPALRDCRGKQTLSADKSLSWATSTRAWSAPVRETRAPELRIAPPLLPLLGLSLRAHNPAAPARASRRP
ncbi:hypothetical protein FB451DRAFT_1178477 [Mycena latifolia]|nr:hypothetical protein FB451DRAFT_1178477 [Mycena latifolia]